MKDMEKRISNAYNDIAPDIWSELEKNVVLTDRSDMVVKEKPRREYWKMAVPMLACVIVMCLVVLVNLQNRVNVYIDVNPSICITLDGKGQVKTVKGVNADGKTFVKGFSYSKNEQLDSVVKNMIVKLHQDNYLKDQDTVLFSVSGSGKYVKKTHDEIVRDIEVAGCENNLKIDTYYVSSKGGTRDGRKYLAKTLVKKYNYSKDKAANMTVEELISAMKDNDDAEVAFVPRRENNEEAGEEVASNEPTTAVDFDDVDDSNIQDEDTTADIVEDTTDEALTTENLDVADDTEVNSDETVADSTTENDESKKQDNTVTDETTTEVVTNTIAPTTEADIISTENSDQIDTTVTSEEPTVEATSENVTTETKKSDEKKVSKDNKKNSKKSKKPKKTKKEKNTKNSKNQSGKAAEITTDIADDSICEVREKDME